MYEEEYAPDARSRQSRGIDAGGCDRHGRPTSSEIMLQLSDCREGSAKENRKLNHNIREDRQKSEVDHGRRVREELIELTMVIPTRIRMAASRA